MFISDKEKDKFMTNVILATKRKNMKIVSKTMRLKGKKAVKTKNSQKVQPILADYNRAHFNLLQFLDKVVEDKILELVKAEALKK